MADTSSPGPVAVYLAEAKARFSATNYAITTESPRLTSVLVASTSDVPRLLAALEAVLGYCAEHERFFGIYDKAGAPVPASEIRRVVAAKLLGEGNG